MAKLLLVLPLQQTNTSFVARPASPNGPSPLAVPVSHPAIAQESRRADPGESFVASPAVPQAAPIPIQLEAAPARSLALAPPVIESIDGFLLAGPQGTNLADRYRAEAGHLLPQGSTDRLLEQTALGLFERDLSRAPSALTTRAPEPLAPGWGEAPAISGGPGSMMAMMQSMAAAQVKMTPVVPPNLTSLTKSSAYVGALASCIAGCPATLTPAVMQALDGFDASKLFMNSGTNRLLAEGGEAVEAAGAVSERKLAAGVILKGAWNDQEASFIEATLEKMRQRIPASGDLVHQVVMRTHLGESVNQVGEVLGHVTGRFSESVRGSLELSRAEMTADPQRAANTIFHEAGHELDSRLGKNGGLRSFDADTPFGKTSRPEDFVTDYASTSPAEDFAETHEDLLKNWDEYQAKPGFYFHGQGRVAEKRRWILEHAYNLEVPPPSPQFSEVIRQACGSDSPFGWKTESGKVGAHTDFTTNLARMWKESSPAQLMAGEVPAADRVKFGWLADKVLGIKIPLAAGSEDRHEQDLTALQNTLQRYSSAPQQFSDLRKKIEQEGSGAEQNLLKAGLNSIQNSYVLDLVSSPQLTKEVLRPAAAGLPLSEFEWLKGSGSLSASERLEVLSEYQKIAQAAVSPSALAAVPSSPNPLGMPFAPAVPPPPNPLSGELYQLTRQCNQDRSELQQQMSFGGAALVDQLSTTPAIATNPISQILLDRYRH